MQPTDSQTQTPKQIEWFGQTDVGRVRKNNEDAFLGLRFNAAEVQRLGKFGQSSMGSMDFAFAVSDGMGGAQAGEFASRIAVEKITALLPKAYQQSARGFQVDYNSVMNELFGEIHQALAHLGFSYEECQGMETTLSLCWFTPGKMIFGHVGDSRIYHFPVREGGIKQITHDDTHVGWLYRTGQINEREARTHPRRNVLQKALGANNQFVTPQVGIVPCEPGDIFLLCTDGLIDTVYDHHLLDLVRPATPTVNENPAQRLIQAALESGSRDNITALVCKMQESYQ